MSALCGKVLNGFTIQTYQPRAIHFVLSIQLVSRIATFETALFYFHCNAPIVANNRMPAIVSFYCRSYIIRIMKRDKTPIFLRKFCNSQKLDCDNKEANGTMKRDRNSAHGVEQLARRTRSFVFEDPLAVSRDVRD